MDARRRLVVRGALACAAVAAALIPASAPTGAAAEDPPLLPPRRRAALLAWLQTFEYRDTYTPEPAVHASQGPHGGNVRTWYSPRLVEDLRDDRLRFRRGAVMVKELYFGSTTVVGGWSVMIKTHRPRRRTPRAWIWYETFELDGSGSYYGRGLRLCSGCHRTGQDFLRSTFRP